ncbi:MAG: hypothetical protein AAFZ09_05720 [Pseudomonadota bacterium]
MAGEDTEALRRTLEIEKQRLECEKLRAEIEQVRQPFWTRSGYIASLSPIVLAVVAFVSAWVTGYFDTQRQQLNAEVEALRDTRDALQAEGEAMRTEVDHVYLQLKTATAEAGYAVAHFGTFVDEGTAHDLAGLLPALPPEMATRLAQALSAEEAEREAMANILAISTAEIERMEASLATLPATAEARDLSHEVGLGLHHLRAPDGRIYDLRERRYLGAAEAAALGPIAE